MTQVSVVIPAYNAMATLDRTIDSVRAQTHKDLEIIIVDDGSSDETVALANRHAENDTRIQVITKQNGGVASARNHGIEIATSDWVAPLDADDIWHPDTVKEFLAAAETAPEPVVFIYTWSRRIDENGHVISDLGRPRYVGKIYRQLLATNFVRNASATMLKRSILVDEGGYDSGLINQGFQGAEDIDLYLKLARVGSVAVAEGYHVGYRQLSNSMSQSASQMRNSIELVLDKQVKQSHLDSDVLALAQTNYDLYAVGISLTGRNWFDVIRYTASALGGKTLFALGYIAIIVPYIIFCKLRVKKMPAFYELKPDETSTTQIVDRIMKLQDQLYGKQLNISSTTENEG